MQGRRLPTIPIGAVFEYWTVIGPPISDERRRPRLKYLCRCRCGLERLVRSDALLKRRTHSCGCHRPTYPDVQLEHHRLTETPEYDAWYSMRARCHNPQHAAYKHYGGRGITVCAEWRRSFTAFLRDMGVRPSPQHSIDRIDNDGGYEKSNVRWATDREQMINRRVVRRYTYNGDTLSLSEWADRTGISRDTLRQRIVDMKWSVARALTEPIQIHASRSALLIQQSVIRSGVGSE